MTRRNSIFKSGRTLFFGLLLSANMLPLYAANELGCPFIRNYTSKEYGAHFQNWAVIQDSRGVIYFGNGYGVLEFDGHYWRLIRVANHSAVRSLAVDAKGTIYVGAVGEFGFLERDGSGRLAYVSLVDKLPEWDRDFGNVWSTHATSRGIYFKPGSKIFRYQEGKIEVIPVRSSPFGSTVNDELFIHDNGLYVIKGNRSLLLPHTHTLAREATGLLFALPYPGSKILLACEKKGFFLYDLAPLLDDRGEIAADFSGIDSRDSRDSRPALLEKLPTEIDEYTRHNQLYSCALVDHYQYAFATLKGGIIMMDLQGNLVRVINKNRGLQKNRVFAVLLDRQRNLWAALNNGISYIQLSSPITRFDDTTGLEDIVLTALRHRGRLYAGAFDGLFYLPGYRLNILDDRHDFLPVKSIETSCWDLLSTKEGLFAAGNFGVTRIAEQNAFEFFVQDLVYCFGKSKKFPAHIFLGRRDGLAALEIGSAIKYFGRQRFAGVKGIIRRIMGDDHGNLWLTTQYSGIIYLRFKGSDIFDFRVYRFGTDHGLPRMDWNRVYQFQNRIIVAAQQGIYEAVLPADAVFDPASIRFVPERTFAQGFNDRAAAVNRLYFDDKNRIWVDSDQGVGTLTRADDGSYRWAGHPFQQIEGDVQDFMIEADSTAWICTTNGLFRCDPAKKTNAAPEFNALIRRVTLHDGSVIFYGDNAAVHSDPSTNHPGESIQTLEYENNSLTFEYAAPFYEHADANRFKYLLNGYDKEWSDWTSETRKEYTNLPEGSYNFKVKAKNIFDHESGTAAYPFVIEPPWQRTIFAYAVYGSIILALLFLALMIHFQRVKQAVRKERRKYEKTFLDPQKADEYLKQLLQFMDRRKPYLDAGVNIKDMAKELGISSYHLSQVINDRLNKNFFDFINEYRINEARRKLSTPGQKETILHVAYEVGFNSNATFSRAFKKHTGMTPRQYRKRGSL